MATTYNTIGVLKGKEEPGFENLLFTDFFLYSLLI